jgi:hypothetical protein
MGKRRREEKLRRKGASRPQLSFRDMLRVFPSLFLRAFVVVVPLTFLMTWLGASKVTVLSNPLVQIAVYVAVYLAFNRFIFAPIRNFKPEKPKVAPSSIKPATPPPKVKSAEPKAKP